MPKDITEKLVRSEKNKPKIYNVTVTQPSNNPEYPGSVSSVTCLMTEDELNNLKESGN